MRKIFAFLLSTAALTVMSALTLNSVTLGDEMRWSNYVYIWETKWTLSIGSKSIETTQSKEITVCSTNKTPAN